MKQVSVRAPLMQKRIEVPDKTNTGKTTTGPQPYDGHDRTNTGESTTHVNKPHTAPPMEIKRTSELQR
jgi:hypothetical protein